MAAKRDPEATRAAILQAAEEEFLQKGFADTSTSAIARGAGVTKSLIHHHFGSKEKLWNEVKVRRFAQYAEAQIRMTETSSPDADLLRRSMKLYFKFLQDNPEVVRLMAWMYLEGDDECTDIDRKVLLAGAEKIREGQENGSLRNDIDPRYILVLFVSLGKQWFQSHERLCSALNFDQPMEQTDAEYLEAMEKIFFEGVLPR
ncbi:MAG: TetR/AcrR family transcriptional regulator [Acidobacteriota bacterium]|nr:TetR/AcrR family transcriptional regulator [Acidobacteriota bacterium]